MWILQYVHMYVSSRVFYWVLKRGCSLSFSHRPMAAGYRVVNPWTGSCVAFIDAEFAMPLGQIHAIFFDRDGLQQCTMVWVSDDGQTHVSKCHIDGTPRAKHTPVVPLGQVVSVVARNA